MDLDNKLLPDDLIGVFTKFPMEQAIIPSD